MSKQPLDFSGWKAVGRMELAIASLPDEATKKEHAMSAPGTGPLDPGVSRPVDERAE